MSVTVRWFTYFLGWMQLNLQTGKWEKEDGQEMTDNDYRREVERLRGNIVEAYMDNYDELKKRIASLLQREDCIKLTEFFNIPNRQLDSKESSDSPTKKLFLILEEEGLVHPSDVFPLQEAFIKLKINPSCYREVSLYQSKIAKITQYERFLMNLSSHINASTARDLCDYFDITHERKDSIISSQNPGLSLLGCLDEIDVIKATDTKALEYPLKTLPLVQALAKLQEYQSTDFAENSDLQRQIYLTSKDKEKLFLECLQRKLRHWYEAMTPVPWKKSCKWKSTDLFVGTGLIIKDFQSRWSPTSIDKECKLKYTEIFSHKNLVKEKRIILDGDPGSGKTMLTAQLAYDWSQNDLQNVDILIWLPLKFVHNKTLIESIKELYIPERIPLLESDIGAFLSSETKVIAVLLDGLEEYNCSVKEDDASEVEQVFNGNKHPNWKVVLTCRSDFAHKLPACPRLQVGLFGDEERNAYVSKLCKDDTEKRNEIEDTINDNPLILDLCSVPLLFVLAVHIIHDGDADKKGHFEGVGPFMKSVISTLIAAEALKDEVSGPSFGNSTRRGLYLGQIAFNGLCMEGQQLVWERQFVERNVGNCREWIDSGVLVTEEIFTIRKFEERKQIEDQKETHSEMVTSQEDDGNGSEQKKPEKDSSLSKYNLTEKNEEQAQGMEDSHMLKTSHSPKITPMEKNVPPLETTNKNTKEGKRSLTPKHVPQGIKFLHKVIQEWFAAVFFCDMMKNCPSRLQYTRYIFEHLSLISPIDLHYVLRFSCFLHPPFCHTVMNHLLQQYRSKKDGRVPDHIMSCVFLCFAEHNGPKGTGMMEVVSDVCKEVIVIHSRDSRLLQRAKATLLKYASESKITIEKLLLTDVIKEVTITELTLTSGSKMPVLDTLRTVEVRTWTPQPEEKLFQDIVDFLSRSQQMMEIICIIPRPPSQSLREKTTITLNERKITVKWMVGENLIHTYDFTKGEWMCQFRKKQLSLLNDYESGRCEAAERRGLLEARAVVCKDGCVLTIPGTGVALNIPPNAFVEDQRNVSLRIIPSQFRDEYSFEDQSTVMVEILPNKLKLQQEAKLFLPHCLEILHPEMCNVQVFESHHDPGTQPMWEDISESISVTLRDSFCELFIKRFCWIKYKISPKHKVKAKKLVVYATGNSPTYRNQGENRAHIDVGYYPALKGESKMFEGNKGENVVTQTLMFLKEPDKGLDIMLTETYPDKWKPNREKNTISYFDIVASNEIRHPFKLTAEQPDESPLWCSFTVSKGGQSVELCITLEQKDQGTVSRSAATYTKIVSREHCDTISQELTSHDWKIVGRFLGLRESTLNHIDSNNPNNQREKAYEMLQKWMEMAGQEASYDVLDEALRKAERADLADTVSKF